MGSTHSYENSAKHSQAGVHLERVVKVDVLLFIAEPLSHHKISVQLRLSLVLFSQLSPWWSGGAEASEEIREKKKGGHQVP